MFFSKYSIYFLLMAFVPFSALSQDITISGVVEDMENIPIYFANALLLSVKDSTVIKGTSTNKDGFFELKNVQENQYVIKISLIGYKEVIKTIDVSNEDILIGRIVLSENTETLDEINIVINKPIIRKEADKLVFTIENTALSEGSLLQVLKSTPGVLILNEQIIVKGVAPTVYINNRKVRLSSDELVQLLESSPANDVKSIEVITNPAANYDAESGSVLNIIMSKNLITGYRGSVFGNYTQGVFPRYHFGMSNYFKNDKINLSANYSHTDQKINRDTEDGIFYYDANNQIDHVWKASNNRNTWSKSHNLNFNVDFLLNEKNSLTFSSTLLWTPYFKYKINNITDVYDENNAFESRFESGNLTTDNKYNLGFDIDYLHQFTKSSMVLNTHYTTYNYNRFQEASSKYFDQNNNFIEPTAFNTDANQKTQIFTAQLDYKLPINEGSNFDAGTKFSNITTASNVSRYDYDFMSQQEVLNTANTSAFDYTENVFAAYANYAISVKKWKFTLGLRMEQTHINGFSITTNQTDLQNYLDWFPGGNIQYQAGEVLSFYTNYKRSIDRPSYKDLNPFSFFLNDNTVVVGNPNLMPVYRNHYVIGSAVTSFLNFESYYINKKDNIVELPLQNNLSHHITYSPVNLDKSVEYGFDVISYFNITNAWFVYAVTSFYNTNEETNTPNGFIEKNKWSNYSVLSNDFSFMDDQSLTVNFTLTYISPHLYALMDVRGRLISELAISKPIFNKKVMATLSASDLFNLAHFKTTTNYLNQRNYYNTNLDDRYIKLGFRYKFGNTILKTNERYLNIKERARIIERN
ncbi:MAG: outer membrane beta-barrel family protein [Xanthomarina sp.]